MGAARIGNRIYAGGGAGTGPVESRVWSYNPHPFPGAWTEIQPMNVPRNLLRMIRLNGMLYAIGGKDDHFASLDVVERYDPQHPANGWEIVSPMHEPRGNPGVVRVGQRVFVVGGAGSAGPLATTEMFDGQHEQWHVLTPLLDPPRASLVAARGAGDRILAIGGFERPASAMRSIASARVQALHVENPGLDLTPSPRRIG